MSSILSIKPEETYVVLIGISEYTKDPENFNAIPGVKNNINDFMEIFTNENIVGIPKNNVLCLLNVDNQEDILTKLATACRLAKDTLIVYYAGHGILSNSLSKYLLTTSGSRREFAEQTTIEFSKFIKEIDGAIVKRKILIVDSCFSGRIMNEKMGDVASVLRANADCDTNGTFWIASSPPNEESEAPKNERNTLFSGALIKTLKDGINEEIEGISLEAICIQTLRILYDMKGPTPQYKSIQNAHKTIIAKNRKFKESKDNIYKYEGKELKNIVDILFHCNKLFEESQRIENNIWFAGLTMGFGSVHNIPAIRSLWQKEHEGSICFEDFSTEFNLRLLALLCGSGINSKKFLVSLNKDLLLDNFIEPLYENIEVYKKYKSIYHEHTKIVLGEINLFQKNIENHGHLIKYIEEMPYQAVVIQNQKREEEMKGVVIYIGTRDIGLKEPKGCYIEDINECMKLIHYVEELYSSGIN